MAKHWMQKAFANSHGQFKAGNKPGESTEEHAERSVHAKGKEGKRARLALAGMRASKK